MDGVKTKLATFDDITQAAIQTGTNRPGLVQFLRQYSITGRSAGGFFWKYADPQPT
jgi:hypothetical protein